MSIKNVDVVIIGSGPAGCSAAIYCKRGGLDVALIGGSYPGGQLLQTSEIENYLGVLEVLDGASFVNNMHKQCAKLDIEIIKHDVIKIEDTHRPFLITTKQGAAFKAPAVIIATGSRARWLGVPGEDKFRGKGVSACATCDGFFFRGKEVAVIGGGNTALEDALFLTRFSSKVHLIHRRDEFRAAHIAVHKARENDKIVFHTSCTPEQIIGSEEGISALKIKNLKTGAFEELGVHGVFIAIGSVPITELAAEAGVELHEDGHIRADLRCRTNIEGLFAAGDCADPLYHQAVIAAGSGAKAGMEAINFVNLHK